MADKKTIGIYKAYLKEHLSKKRYTHSMNVANSAVELAKRYGADADKAYIAGLLHDVAKEIPALELAAIVSKSSLDVCDIEKKAVPLFHGIAGAELVQTLFDIHDPEIISAIRYHTVACGNMPKLSQIVLSKVAIIVVRSIDRNSVTSPAANTIYPTSPPHQCRANLV